jgi:hypothetical protein
LGDTNYATQVTGCRFAASTSYSASGFARAVNGTSVTVFIGYEDTFSGQIPTDAEFVYVAIFR